MLGELVEVTVGIGPDGPGAVMRGFGRHAGSNDNKRRADGRKTETAGTAQGSVLRVCETLR